MIAVTAGGWAAEDMLAPLLFGAQARVDQRAKGGTSSYVKREPVSNVKIYDLELTLEQKVVLVASPREQVPERKQTVRGSVWLA